MDREVVEESAQDRFVNSASYGKKKGAARWSAEETELFYDVRGNPPSFRSRTHSDLILVSLHRACRNSTPTLR